MERITDVNNPLARFKAFERPHELAIFGPPGLLLKTSDLPGNFDLRGLTVSRVGTDGKFGAWVTKQTNLQLLKLTFLTRLDCNFSKLTNLKTIDLAGTKLHTATVASLEQSCKVETLSLAGTGISSLPDLGGLCLRELTLTSLPIGDSELEKIASYRTLESLHVEGTQVSDRGVELISDLSDLRFLAINNTRVSSKAYNSIARLSQLEELYIDVPPHPEHSGALSSLKKLTAIYCGDTIDETAKSLFSEHTQAEVY